MTMRGLKANWFLGEQYGYECYDRQAPTGCWDHASRRKVDDVRLDAVSVYRDAVTHKTKLQPFTTAFLYKDVVDAETAMLQFESRFTHSQGQGNLFYDRTNLKGAIELLMKENGERRKDESDKPRHDNNDKKTRILVISGQSWWSKIPCGNLIERQHQVSQEVSRLQFEECSISSKPCMCDVAVQGILR